MSKKKFVTSYSKFQSNIHTFNQVCFMGDYIVILHPNYIFFAIASAVTLFTEDAIRVLNGYSAPTEMWNTLLKASNVNLYPDAKDPSEIKAVVEFESYESEVAFKRCDDEIYQTVGMKFRSYLLQGFKARSLFNVDIDAMQAFLSVVPGNGVLVNPIDIESTEYLLSDAVGVNFMVCTPMYDDPMFIKESFEVAKKYLSEAKLVDSLRDFRDMAEKYQMSITATLDGVEKQLF